MTFSDHPVLFNAKYKPNQVIAGTGNIAIVTGWTIKNSISKRLNSKDYAVIGQLYSPTRGISFLVRNLLLNPQVRYLSILNATKEDKNAGGVQALADFFEFGFRKGVTDTGKPCWIINSKVVGYIDIEIDEIVLEQLRLAIQMQSASTIESLISQVETIVKANFSLPPWGKPIDFPLPPEPEAITLSGPRYGHRIEGRTIAETWVKIIHRIKTTGTIRPTGYDGKWQELIDLIAVVTEEPTGFYFPEPNYLPCTSDFIKEYIPQILDNAPYQEGVKYTYGQRLRSWFGQDQIEQVIQKLVAEIDAASAVMSLWDVRDHESGGSPCLNHIWLRVVDNEISLTATFRSNDMFSAWPANAMGLRALQHHICTAINERCSNYGLTLGPLITISQSAHIYDDCWNYADRIIEQHYQQKFNQDPIGNFLIFIENGTIFVQQTTPGSGSPVANYTGKRATQVAGKIVAANPAITPEHAIYLGTELQKAEYALKKNQEYTQDKLS